MQPTSRGDEPHYLVFAHSLAHDFDLDLRNNYVPETIVRYHPDPALRVWAIERADGRLLSISYIGLPLLLAPVLAVGGGLLAVRLEMVLISALLAQQLYSFLRDLRLAGATLTWLAWTAVVFCLPLLAYSNQIYPEVPAALVVVFVGRAVFTRHPAHKRLLLAAAGAATLIWLHPRFVPLAIASALGIGWHLFGRPSLRAIPRVVTGFPGPVRGWTSLLALVAIPLSGALLLVFFSAEYGSASPAVAYLRPEMVDAVGWMILRWTPDTLYRHGLGTLLSPSTGWLPFSPVHWLGMVGLVPLLVQRRAARFGFAALLGYWLIISASFGGGDAFPARYAVVVVPLVAIPLLFVLRDSLHARVLFAPLLALSLAIAGVATTHHEGLYPALLEGTRLPILRDLQQVWPEYPRSVVQFGLTADQLSRQVGRVAENDPNTVRASAALDPPGYLAFGPYVALRQGTYVARYLVAARATGPGDYVATLDVTSVELGPSPSIAVLARARVYLAEFLPDGGFTTLELPFAMPANGRVETRVYFAGAGQLELRSIEVVASQDTITRHQRFPQWPTATLWVIGTLLFGTLLLSSCRSIDPRQ